MHRTLSGILGLVVDRSLVLVDLRIPLAVF
jgi:hypothetical protein